jgi:hypothetical protein
MRLALPLLLLAGCAARPVTQIVPTEALGLDLPPVALPSVHLIDAGKAPRTSLSYNVIRGHTERLVLELTGSLTLTIGDMTPPEVRGPPLRFTVDLLAKDLDGAGRCELGGVVAAVEIPPGPEPPGVVRAALAGDLERLGRVTFRMLITRRGVLERLLVPLPPDASAELTTMVGWLREALTGLFPVLPSEPIGAQGRWQVRRRVNIGPAVAEENNVYALGEGNPLRATIRMALSAGAQHPPVAGLPPGATVVLTSLAGSGGGQVDLDLNRLAQPQQLRWSSTALGSAEPRGEPRAEVRMVTAGSWLVRTPAAR